MTDIDKFPCSRIVPRQMILAGFDPLWIWDEMVSDLRSRGADIRGANATIAPDQQADVMVWAIETCTNQSGEIDATV